MEDWFSSTLNPGAELSVAAVASRLGFACLAGLLVAATCRAAHGRRQCDSPSFLTTLVLLTVLIAMTTMVIGNNVARAFGLVGALSIVRFRTVVEDTRDTAFVIFAVVVGMALGAGSFVIPLLGIPMVTLLAILLERGRAGHSATGAADYRLVTRLGLGRDPQLLLDSTLSQHCSRHVITATSTARQGTSLEVTHRLTIDSDRTLPILVTALHQIDGVQAVELSLERR